jgi:DNA polymerase III epsilon subunit-like protein
MPLAPLSRPLVVFDLETTGLLVELDRIIEIGLVKLFPDGRRNGWFSALTRS